MSEKKTGRLLILRHGETKMNAKDGERLRGRSQVDLEPEGRAEARSMGRFLAPMHIHRVYSSPLPRTMETARIVGGLIDTRVRQDDGLLSWDVGYLTGKPVDDVWNAVANLEKHPDQEVPDGETYRTFYERWAEALWKYVEQARRGVTNTLLVSHARNLTAVPLILRKHGPQALDWEHAPEPGSILEVDVDGPAPKVSLLRGSYSDKTLRS